jgi:hypothetical protein
MPLPCLRIHGVVMFHGVEVFMMAPTKNLTMEKKLKIKKNVNVKQNLNEYTGHEFLTLSDVETPIMENFKQAYVSET